MAVAKRKYRTYKKNVGLGKGQTLHYTPGKGYWAGPAGPARVAPPRPVDPFAPIPAAQLERRATEMAANALAPEQKEIERQRQIAAVDAERQRQQILAMGGAVNQMTQGIGPGMQAAYGQAAGQMQSIGAGLSEGIGSRMTEIGGANVAFAQGQGAPVDALGPNVSAMKDVQYGLNGVVPAASMLAQGAAAGAWGAGLSAITAHTMRGDFDKAMYEANAQDDAYAKQLIDLAAKSPQLRDQALEALRKHELDKAGFVQERSQTNRQLGIQERAQTLYEKQFGEEQRENLVGEGLKRVDQGLEKRSIMLGEAKYELDTKEHRQRVAEAEKKGRKVDAAASKVYGFIVDVEGNFILDKKGRKIKVKPAASGKGKGTQEERNPYGAAVEAAKTLRGEPVSSKGAGGILGMKGKYIARPGVKGVFPDGSTNNPALARRDSEMTFAEAIGYLQARYGLTRARARAALVASGWKPDGVRPAPKSGR